MTQNVFDPLEVAHAVERTRSMRTSDLNRWKGVRHHLRATGIDPIDVAVGGLFPEDVGMECAVLMTRDGRCFEVDFELGVDDEGNELGRPDDGMVWEWQEVKPTEEGAFGHIQALGRYVLANE